jgi:superfamily II DNA or RNA helicase/intein/homing endonuclease
MTEIATYLGPKGYSIKKEYLDIQEQHRIRKELTVLPFVPKSSLSKPNPFPIYRESKKKLYVPKYYGFETYGIPDDNTVIPGDSIDLKFKGQLRDFQKPIVNKFVKHVGSSGGGLLEVPCGRGKTVMGLNIVAQLKTKTLIIVHKEFLLRQWMERIQEFLPTARIGRIQGEILDIDDKDIVMGMLQSLSMKEYPNSVFDSFGLTIIDECFPFQSQIHTNQGIMCIGTLHELFKNKQELPKILSFNRETQTFEYKRMTWSWRKEREELIKIKLSKRVINCTPEHKILSTKGYVEANKLKIGDLIISKYDKNQIDSIVAQGLNEDQLQLVYGSYLGDGHIDITVKSRHRLLFTHGEKQHDYCLWKANMFGIKTIKRIEKNGYSQKPAYTFSTKIFDLRESITKNTKEVPNWLLNKLDERGIAIWYMDDGSICKNVLKDKTESHFIRIHSNNFDYDTHEKFVDKFKTYNIDCSIHKSKGKYCYLQFNKENSTKLLKLVSPYIHKCMNYKIVNREENYEWNSTFLDYGTLRVTNISHFKNKGYGRCKKPYVYDIEVEDNHNFIIGSEASEKNTQYVCGPVVSNCHHIGAEVFSRALFKIVTPYMLGLSATMDRKDNLSSVFKLFIGPVVHSEQRKGGDNVLVRSINYYHDDEEFATQVLNYKGQVHYSIMIKKLCEFNFRSEFILRVLKDLFKENPNQQIIVLGHNKSLLAYLHDAIQHRNIESVGYYVGGMKEKDLKITETKKIIIATYAMAEEGLDIKTLTTLLMATPKTDVRQAVGRILRQKHGTPLIIDIVDQHELFKRQWLKRKRYYKKQKYKIVSTDMDSYNKKEWTTLFENGKIRKSKKQDAGIPQDKFLQGVCMIGDD